MELMSLDNNSETDLAKTIVGHDWSLDPEQDRALFEEARNRGIRRTNPDLTSSASSGMSASM